MARLAGRAGRCGGCREFAGLALDLLLSGVCGYGYGCDPQRQRVTRFDVNSLSWTTLRGASNQTSFSHLSVWNDELYALSMSNVSTIFKLGGDGAWSEIETVVTDEIISELQALPLVALYSLVENDYATASSKSLFVVQFDEFARGDRAYMVASVVHWRMLAR